MRRASDVAPASARNAADGVEGELDRLKVDIALVPFERVLQKVATMDKECRNLVYQSNE